mgnify:CR=1 FL=1
MKYFRVLRYIAYVIELLVVFILQQTPGLMPTIYGILPTLLLPAVFAVAIFERPVCALFYGVFTGFLLDYGSGSVFGFHALILGLICFLISFLVQDLFHNNFLTAMIMLTIASVLVLLLQWLFLYLPGGVDSAVYALYRHYLPRIAYTVVWSPLFYYFNRSFAYLLRGERIKR